MFIAECTLHSVSPYSQSRNHDIPKQKNRTADDHDRETWREHLHVRDGEVVIPAMAIKGAMSTAGKYLYTKVAGQGNSTYTKHFEAGVLIPDDLRLGIKAEEVEGERLFLNADGKKGGNKRVWRTYPVIPQWQAATRIYVIDDVITREIFEKYIKTSGQLIGIGRFRPEKGGMYGRFEVRELRFLDYAI